VRGIPVTDVAKAAAMMPLIRIEVTPALNGIFIKRANVDGPKTTALQSLSRKYSGFSWFRSSVGEQTWSTMKIPVPDRLTELGFRLVERPF
jgi:hypothetical protein